jgi:acetyl esterase/lipase
MTRIAPVRPLRVFVLMLVVFGAFYLLLGTSTGRANLRATMLVADLLSPTQNSILQGITLEPILTSIQLPTSTHHVEARYYRPSGEGPYGALILVLGYPSNIDDRAINQVAQNLARLGVAVLLPRLPHLKAGELDRRDVDALIDAFEWLENRSEISPNQIGFAGFCVGSSLALLAAEDLRINEQVALVNVFGGYYGLRSYIRSTAAWSAHYNGKEYPWQPSIDTETLLVRNIFRHLPDPQEVNLIRDLLLETEQPTISLSPAGMWAYRLLSASEPGEVDKILSQIPDEHDQFIDDLSPSTNIQQVKAKLYIMHDLSDPFVPNIEAYRLIDGAPDPSRVKAAEFVLFRHVRPDPKLNRLTIVGESLRLIRFLGPLLADLEVN